MSQSGFIAAMLLAAFILWLAVNDRLQTYTAVLFGPTQAPTPQGNISNKNGIIGPAPVAAAGAGAVGSAGSLTDESNIIDSTGEFVTEGAGLLETGAELLAFL